jgi:hypothetical protein
MILHRRNFTRHYNPEDSSEHHTRRRENLKSHMLHEVGLDPTDWHKYQRIRCELASKIQFLVVTIYFFFYFLQTRQRPLALDEFGEKFMKPGSHVSYQASNDNIIQQKNERKLTKQTEL